MKELILAGLKKYGGRALGLIAAIIVATLLAKCGIDTEAGFLVIEGILK